LCSDPYDASTVGNSCIQNIDKTYGDFIGLDMWNAKSPLSEDCLSLNIWVPRRSPATTTATSTAADIKSKKAVMVHIIAATYSNKKTHEWIVSQFWTNNHTHRNI